MKTTLAVKITQSVFCYQLIGFNRIMVYDTKNRNLILAEAITGAPIRIVAKDEDLDFETFTLVARNMYLDLIELSN